MIIGKIETKPFYINDFDLFISEEERELYFASSEEEKREFILSNMDINNLFEIIPYDEDDCIYSPNELYFSVNNSELEDYSGVKFVVYFTTINCFEKEGCQSDNLGGHNIDQTILKDAGLCEVELMESVFEVYYGNSIEEVHQNLLNAGFIFNSEFDKFIKSNFQITFN